MKYSYEKIENKPLPSLKIGNIEFSNPLILAPMSGVTCSSFRRLIKLLNPNSVGYVVSEFISIEGLTRANKRSLEMMEYFPEEKPFGVQIFGHDPKRMVDAALMAQDAGADIVDINCGCPAPKVVKKGGGCELMRQPEHLQSILEKTKTALSVPLTLKIRAGWDECSMNYMEIAKIAEGSGVDMLAIHPRTRQQSYRGHADWDIIKEVAASLSIPVVGSGDICSYEDAQAAVNAGVQGLMIGRGALENPWVFRQILEGYAGDVQYQPNREEIFDVLVKYSSLLESAMPSRGVLGRLKQLITRMSGLLPDSGRVRKALCRSQSSEEFFAFVELFKSLNEEEISTLNLESYLSLKENFSSARE